jgi:hypothetical protein
MLRILTEEPSTAGAAALLHHAAPGAPAHDNVTVAVAVADVRAVQHSRFEPPATVGAAAFVGAESTQPLRCVGWNT